MMRYVIFICLFIALLFQGLGCKNRKSRYTPEYCKHIIVRYCKNLKSYHTAAENDEIDTCLQKFDSEVNGQFMEFHHGAHMLRLLKEEECVKCIKLFEEIIEK